MGTGLKKSMTRKVSCKIVCGIVLRRRDAGPDLLRLVPIFRWSAGSIRNKIEPQIAPNCTYKISASLRVQKSRYLAINKTVIFFCCFCLYLWLKKNIPRNVSYAAASVTRTFKPANCLTIIIGQTKYVGSGELFPGCKRPLDRPFIARRKLSFDLLLISDRITGIWLGVLWIEISTCKLCDASH